MTAATPIAEPGIPAVPANESLILDFDNRETHWHRCDRCQCVWAHTRVLGCNKEEYTALHTCSKCGQVQFNKATVTENECLTFLATPSVVALGTIRLANLPWAL